MRVFVPSWPGEVSVGYGLFMNVELERVKLLEKLTLMSIKLTNLVKLLMLFLKLMNLQAIVIEMKTGYF